MAKPKTLNERKLLGETQKTKEKRHTQEEAKKKLNPLSKSPPQQERITTNIFQLIDIRHPGCIDGADTIYFTTTRIQCNLDMCRRSDYNCRRCMAVADRGWEKRLKEVAYKYRMKKVGAHHLRGNWAEIQGAK